ncbi:hypothetical protein [Anaerococcus hydrogenalis]|uniref:Uncharacterized protein n=1 Tax=Anaerococcus hydrogenalis TaxID=33029 RepID=A0A2N6UJH1_9FIRM|nr:hypothetical protein [Anaerococcus hydrogenalis]MDK7695212.1 hypothetical protein [Anaerococcus hydrogenalis]MDK7696813.1 hypothetical protein [Anaerococcus hydrogenalis]MDK7708239.1 hypothetical protein [Anaerococcus hydrogenalis]PMC81812.1 hypothetical protein CJ192_03420 [Anaerococcus hydrogenalis]
MYPTSEEYKTVIKKNSRKFYWTGNIILEDGTTIPFNNKDILKGSGYIHRSCSGSSELEIGTVYAGEFGISLFSDIDRYSLEDSKLELFYHQELENKKIETIPMGIFDVTEANRSKKILELKGYDYMLRFDKNFPVTDTFGTAFELLTLSCEKCKVELGMTEDEVKAFVNGEEVLAIYQDHDIETYRDFIHYIGSTLGAFAGISRDGKLILKKYAESISTEIKTRERFSSSISDFKTRYTAINSTNAKTKIAEYYSLENDDGLTMNLGINPLMQLGLPEKRKRMCEVLLTEICKIHHTPFDMVTIGDPSLDVGDRIAISYEEEKIEGLTTDIEYKINGKHRILGVGKNPYLSKAKSKNDKNIVGLLNQIESEKLVVHAYSNYTAFNLSTTDTPIIRIEFASNKETEAIFNASILLNIICDTEEKTRKISRKVKKQVEILNNEGKSYNPPKFEGKEEIEELNYIENIEIPTRLVITYVFNDTKIEHHIPKETYLSGDHILNLFYPLTKLQEKTMNNFSVLIRLESGQAMISKDNAIAAISGQSLGSTEAWDGKIKIEESWKKFTFSNLFLFSNLLDYYKVEKQEPTKTEFKEKVERFKFNGIKLGNYKDKITTEIKNKEV